MSANQDVQEILENGVEVAQGGNDRQEAEEIVRGVRRHRSGVLRRPRPQALLSPPVLRDFPTLAKRGSSLDDEAVATLPSSASHVVENSLGSGGQAGTRTEFPMGGSTETRSRDRVSEDSKSAEDEMEHEDDDTLIEKSLENFVYIRRGDATKKFNGRKDGKDSQGDEGEEGNRFEGKGTRKRDVSDIKSAKNVDEWRFNRNGADRDNLLHPENGRGSGSGTRVERSWEEMPQREGRKRILKTNRDKETNGGGKFYAEDRFERTQSASEKGLKGEGGERLSTKMKVGVGGKLRRLHSDASRKRKQDVSSDFNGKATQGKAGKAPELVKKRRHRLILQDNSDDDDYEPWPVLTTKDVNTTSSPIVEGQIAVKEAEENNSVQVGRAASTELHSQGVRKSSRVPKKKVLGDFEDYEPNDRIDDGGIDGDPVVIGRPQKRSEEDDDVVSEKDAGYSDKDASECSDSSDDVDGEFNSPKTKGGRSKDTPKTQDTFLYPGKGRNAPLTARQRTMQLSKDGDADVGPSLIEFPTGLMHQTRRGREKLTEEERQVKKMEATNRRKQLVEKAATEIQASAIQKILGHDSSRKRKEDRLLKRRIEIEQGKKDAALEPASNIVRWTLGPQRTTVWWSQDVELPKILSSSSGPPTYPPVRENCARPMCNNIYKYRDSSSRLPLCSLQCYRAIQPAASALLSN